MKNAPIKIEEGGLQHDIRSKETTIQKSGATVFLLDQKKFADRPASVTLDLTNWL
jgi:hypothetical protein